MKRLAAALLLAPLVAVLACSGSSAPEPTSGAPGAPGAPLAGGPKTVTFTMNTTIKAGAEAHKCQFVAMPEGSAYVVASSHEYTVGSHHLLLFRTDLSSIPEGMDKLQDCYETGGDSVMSHVRGIVYGAQEPKAESRFPKGVGLPTLSKEVFLFQSHYLNSGAKDLDAKVTVNLEVTDGADVTQKAGVLFFYDPFIHVGAGQKARASMRCAIRNDITLLTAVSHYHKRGTEYSAFLDLPNAPLSTTPFYTSNAWDHPDSLRQTMQIPAGSRIRFGCGYDNTRGTREYFQGQSAEDDEMCMFTGVYYPDMGLSDNFCMNEPDMFGTGKATCRETQDCVQACPAGSAPKLGAASGGKVDPCWQRCFVASCPSAAAPLLKQFSCIQSKCKEACASAGSPQCASCAIGSCPAEVSSCQAQACN